MRYLVANWKSNLTLSQVKEWVNAVKPAIEKLAIPQGKLSIIVCPPFPFLDVVSQSFAQLPYITIGAQNISHLGKGAYTGEVSAENLHSLARYVLVGHSERRENLGETDDILQMKVDEALGHNLTPIYCIRDSYDSVPERVTIAAYEPVESIGTGENTPPADVINALATLSMPDRCACLYGGSVNAENIVDYFAEEEIAGVLVGSASLSADTFIEMVTRVSQFLTSPHSESEDNSQVDQG